MCAMVSMRRGWNNPSYCGERVDRYIVRAEDGPIDSNLQALMFFVWTRHLPPCAFRVSLEDYARLKFMCAYKRRLVLAGVTTRDGPLTLFISSKHASLFIGRVVRV